MKGRCSAWRTQDDTAADERGRAGQGHRLGACGGRQAGWAGGVQGRAAQRPGRAAPRCRRRAWRRRGAAPEVSCSMDCGQWSGTTMMSTSLSCQEEPPWNERQAAAAQRGCARRPRPPPACCRFSGRRAWRRQGRRALPRGAHMHAFPNTRTRGAAAPHLQEGGHLVAQPALQPHHAVRVVLHGGLCGRASGERRGRAGEQLQVGGRPLAAAARRAPGGRAHSGRAAARARASAGRTHRGRAPAVRPPSTSRGPPAHPCPPAARGAARRGVARRAQVGRQPTESGARRRTEASSIACSRNGSGSGGCWRWRQQEQHWQAARDIRVEAATAAPASGKAGGSAPSR